MLSTTVIQKRNRLDIKVIYHHLATIWSKRTAVLSGVKFAVISILYWRLETLLISFIKESLQMKINPLYSVTQKFKDSSNLDM